MWKKGSRFFVCIMVEKFRFGIIVCYFRLLKKMVFFDRNVLWIVVLNCEIVDKILRLVYFMMVFIGYWNKYYWKLGIFGLVFWICNLVCYFLLDFYEVVYIFGWVWVIVIGLFFVFFSLGIYVLIRDIFLWFEDGLEILNVDGNFFEMLEKVCIIMMVSIYKIDLFIFICIFDIF